MRNHTDPSGLSQRLDFGAYSVRTHNQRRGPLCGSLRELGWPVFGLLLDMGRHALEPIGIKAAKTCIADD